MSAIRETLMEIKDMAKKLAVMILHGMGDHGDRRPDDSAKPSYSKKLHRAVRKSMGRHQFDENIAWREVCYSHVTQKNQDEYLRRIKGKRLRGGILRSLVIKYLGDVPAYKPAISKYDKTDIYQKIHAEVEMTVAQLRADTSKAAPLIILAHSLGGHVISNYIYDMQKKNLTSPDMNNMNTVASLITFGCNIPIFTFGWSFDDISAIKDPGRALASQLHQKPWWRNYYDRDDVLGYPLAQTGKGYAKLDSTKQLEDKPIDAGWPIASMTLFSHSMYWGDVDLVDPVTTLMKKLVKAA